MSKKKRKKTRRADIERLAAIIAQDMGKGLFGRTEEYVGHIGQLFTAACDALTKLAAGTDLDPATEVFSFSDSKRMSEKSAAILRGLYSSVYNEVKNAVLTEWENANSATDRLIAAALGNDVRDDRRFARLFARNREAVDAFFSRKNEYGGLNLSQRVWKYTGQFKEEMELALSASLGRGDSAATVSRKVRQYMKEPERLFRRVRDADGNLKLSKRAAAYHPGRGEYRSSYKNAMRMTRTEVNMAYRAADCDRWSGIPFVVGMEVKRSNHPFGCEVCEALKGKYPKDFKFTGWHPQCRCYIVPVLASEEERMAYHRAILNGEDVSDWKFKGEITEPHEGFQKWMKENAERIENAKSLPYWMRDNGRYVEVTATSSIRTDEVVEPYNGVPDKKGRFVEISHENMMENLQELSGNFTHEEAYVKLANGKVFYKRGDEKQVSFNSEERAMFVDGELYHNHKNETLSPDDISFAINNKMKSIVAVTKGINYEAQITAETVTKSKDEVLKLYKQLGDEIEKEMKGMNSIDYMNALLNFQHLNIKALCENLKVDYKWYSI